uniref:Putative secreted protein n=1 Tax=Anopheles aquasalis TaxID=42839 RepID=T1DHW0_ANOAQ
MTQNRTSSQLLWCRFFASFLLGIQRKMSFYPNRTHSSNNNMKFAKSDKTFPFLTTNFRRHISDLMVE